MYSLLRVVAGIALRWFYRDIRVYGVDRIPSRGPVLIVANHPNALVDALLVGWTVPRRVLITAKATLFVNRVVAAILSYLGVLPLRRAIDEQRTGESVDPRRNAETFAGVHDAFRKDGVVLIFPEGLSRDEPSLAPLKTGAARMALSARDDALIPGLSIVPIGLVYERKDTPRTRVFVHVGEPILVDEWHGPEADSPVETLTREIENRLRAITLNYATAGDASRVATLASLIASVSVEPPAISSGGRSLGFDAAIARRIAEVNFHLPMLDQGLRTRVDDVRLRLFALKREASGCGIAVEDIDTSLRLSDALRFLTAEALVTILAGPMALWGRITHWIPLRAARFISLRSVESAADPAMRMIIAGTAFVLISYIVQGLLVVRLAGPLLALIYLMILPVAADLDFYLSDRLILARRRARAFLILRHDQLLRTRLQREAASLRTDLTDLESDLRETRRRQG